jgi:hypothetical protein
VNTCTKAEESSDSEKQNRKHENEPEFGFVDAVVPPCQNQADVVIKWSGNDLSDDSHNKWGNTNEANLRHGEIVRRKREDRGVDDAEHHNPGQGCAVYKKSPKNGRVPEYDHWTNQNLPEWGV